MCLGALGTQTAGSILRPSAYCGAVGFKPTYDAVSREGVIPLAWSMDHVGPITKTVEDAALVYGALRGDVRPMDRQPDDRPVTVGVPDRFFDTDDRDVAAAFESALAAARELGWDVQPIPLPASFEAAAQAAMVIITAEIAAVHEDWFEVQPDEYGPQLRGFIEAGQRILALTTDRGTAPHVARLLTDRGYGRSTLTVLEHLGGHDETVTMAQAAGFRAHAPGPFSEGSQSLIGQARQR